jgi:lysyl-tRNA synthetase class II
MKKHLRMLAVLVSGLIPASALAQANKPEPATAATATKPAAPAGAKSSDAAKPAEKEKEVLKALKPMPMNSRVDEIDAAGKTFTQVTRDGRRIKHVITTKTEINQGKDRAKFEDIKVGDIVAGSRLKKNADGTEYEVIKITKFSAKAAKADEKK